MAASKIKELDDTDFDGYDLKRGKVWHNALRRAIKSDDGRRVRRAADKLLDAAADGESWAIRELADRVDGKAGQDAQQGNGLIGPITVNIVSVERPNVIEHVPPDPMVLSMDTLATIVPTESQVVGEPGDVRYTEYEEVFDVQLDEDKQAALDAALDLIPRM